MCLAVLLKVICNIVFNKAKHSIVKAVSAKVKGNSIGR